MLSQSFEQILKMILTRAHILARLDKPPLLLQRKQRTFARSRIVLRIQSGVRLNQRSIRRPDVARRSAPRASLETHTQWRIKQTLNVQPLPFQQPSAINTSSCKTVRVNQSCGRVFVCVCHAFVF